MLSTLSGSYFKALELTIVTLNGVHDPTYSAEDLIFTCQEDQNMHIVLVQPFKCIRFGLNKTSCGNLALFTYELEDLGYSIPKLRNIKKNSSKPVKWVKYIQGHPKCIIKYNLLSPESQHSEIFYCYRIIAFVLKFNALIIYISPYYIKISEKYNLFTGQPDQTVKTHTKTDSL